MIIALDGPAASGKGTIARLLGERLGLPVLDTGKLYRLVALEAIEQGIHPLDEEALAQLAAERLPLKRLTDPELSKVEVARVTPLIAQSPRVRAALRAFQRRFAAQPGGAILDGRDIGTVVCPEADVKIFVTADLPVRAKRRQKELRRRREAISLKQILAQIAERDERDMNRADSPLRPAPDAHMLDTTNLSVEEAAAAAIAIVERARAAG